MIFAATCQIWKVENNLKRVIDYANNKDKINDNEYNDLHNELEYITLDSKTENKLYSDGINCNVETAYEEMQMIKEHYHKTDGIVAFHSFHSFKEGEVTPELAHKIGIELAQKVWGDRFQVVVATHLNTNHIHNHFVINSVSFVDGKRYYDNRTSYAYLRKCSNDICKSYGLSYLEEKVTKKGIDYSKYQNIDYSNYYKKAKRDLDYVIANSNTYEEFINKMHKLDYNVIVRSNKLSIRHKDYKRNIRIERYFGEAYSIKNINLQIKGLYIPEKKYYYHEYSKDKLLDVLLKTHQKGLAYTYIKYLKLLNKYSKINNKKISYELKQDIDKMDMISKQTVMLVENNIENENDLRSFYLELKKDSKNNKENINLCNEIIKRKNIILENIDILEKEVINRE